MKSLFKISFTICCLCVFLSCDNDTITASDEITSRTYSFSGYTALKVADNFSVTVNFSETEEKIEVEANDNLHGNIRVHQIGEVLAIELKDVKKIKGTETLNVFVTTRSLSNFMASGNSKLVIEDVLDTPQIKINLTGNNWFTAAVASKNIDLLANGNCMIDFSGRTNTMDAKLSGNCGLADFDLTVENLKIDLSGNSNANLAVNGSIDIVAKGNSVLTYRGDAEVVRQELSSASRIVKI